jgi:hypothetical protein
VADEWLVSLASVVLRRLELPRARGGAVHPGHRPARTERRLQPGVDFVWSGDPETRCRIAAPAQDVMSSSGHHTFVAQAPVHVVVCVSPEIYKARYRPYAEVVHEERW